MAEIIVNDEVVPVNRVAAEVARLKVVRRALDEAPYISHEGWGDGGHFAFDLAESNPEGINDSLEAYQNQTLYSLQGLIPHSPGSDSSASYESIYELKNINAIGGRHYGAKIEKVRSRRANQYAEFAGAYALIRCGVIKHYATSREITGQTIAAYAYFRANIKEDLDRQVYANWEKIEDSVALAMPQSLKVASKEGVSPYDNMSLYRFMGHVSKNHDGTVSLPDGRVGSPVQLWWDILEDEISRITLPARR